MIGYENYTTPRVTITFYWPWARLGSMVRSRAAKAGDHGQTTDAEADGSRQKAAATSAAKPATTKASARKGIWFDFYHHLYIFHFVRHCLLLVFIFITILYEILFCSLFHNLTDLVGLLYTRTLMSY